VTGIYIRKPNFFMVFVEKNNDFMENRSLFIFSQETKMANKLGKSKKTIIKKALSTARKLKPKKKVPSDIDIAQSITPITIIKIAKAVGLSADDIDPYGRYMAKVHLDVLKKFSKKSNGKYIVVTAITPTPLGEGKTTTTVGLSQAIGAHLNKKVFTCYFFYRKKCYG